MKEYCCFKRDRELHEKLTARGEYNGLKIKRCREVKKDNQNLLFTRKGFATPQPYGKAIEKLKTELPRSPSKRVEAVMGLVNEVGLKLK